MTTGPSSSQCQKKKQHIKKLLKYAIHLQEIPPGIKVEGDMLGHIDNLTYSYRDIQDLAKFKEFTQERYMNPIHQPLGIVVFEEGDWEFNLKTSNTLRLLDIPQFRRIQEVNTYIKQLLSCVHGGFLWLDEKVEIIAQLTLQITRLPI